MSSASSASMSSTVSLPAFGIYPGAATATPFTIFAFTACCGLITGDDGADEMGDATVCVGCVGCVG